MIVLFKTQNIEDRFRETWILYQWVCDKLKLLNQNEKLIDFDNISLKQLLKQYEKSYKSIPKMDLSAADLQMGGGNQIADPLFGNSAGGINLAQQIKYPGFGKNNFYYQQQLD